MSFADSNFSGTPEEADEYNFKNNCLNSLDKHVSLLNNVSWYKKSEGSEGS